MNATKRIGVKKIKLYRAEGVRLEMNNRTREVTTWKGAEEILLGWSHTAPKPDEGYHKCDIEITWDNDHTIKFRYDLYRIGSGFESLSKHVHGMLSFNGGVGKPSHFSESDYRRYLTDMVARYSGASVEKW